MTHDITCKQLVDLVAAYMDEKISDEARAKFEQHLSECGYCTAYVQQIKVTVKLTNQLADEKPKDEAPKELVNLFRKWKEEHKLD